ncbi:hypothetical protein QTV49_001696 [Vibrio vulnificus]|nr:hypothetical protein [Vibrio vulnificus]
MLGISKKIIALIAVFMFPMIGVASSVEEDPNGCDVYLNDHGYPLPKPFSSTICPNDKSIASTLYHFPATMETAIKLTNLEYKDDILRLVKVSGLNSDLDVVSRKDEYRNDIINLEDSVISIQGLAIYLVSALMFVQLVVLSFAALRSGELGGGRIGLFKSFSRIGVGAVLIAPLPVNSELMGSQTDVLVIQVIMGVAVLAAIGAANIAISTVGYMLISDFPDNREKTFLETDGTSNLSSIPITKSRILIEDAICAAQTSLLGVYAGAKNNSTGSKATLSRGGNGYQYSTIGDGYASLIEISSDEKGFSTSVGFNIDNGSGKAEPYLCSEKRVNRPSYVSDITLPDMVKYNETKNLIITLIDSKVEDVSFEDMSSKDKLIELWGEVKANIDILLEGLSSDINREKLLISSANYFFDNVMYVAEGGRLSGQDPESYDVFNRRAELADRFAKLVVSDRCYTDRKAYIRTKDTVDSLNLGNIGVSDFSLQCAIVEGGKLKMPFDADSSSLQSFFAGSLEASNQGRVQLQDLYVEIYDSFNKYNSTVELARQAVVKGITQAIIYAQSSQSSKLTINEISKAIREEGFASFSHNFLSLARELNYKTRQILRIEIQMDFKPIETSRVLYSASSNFLPPVDKELSRYLSQYKVKAPEFLYVKSNSGGNGDLSEIAASADAQMFTEQGGSHSSRDGSRSETDLSYTGGAVESKLGATQTNSIEDKVKISISDTLNSALRNLSRSGGDNGSEVATIQLTPEKYHQIVSLCGVKDQYAKAKEVFGLAGVAVLEQSCEIYMGHQQFYAQNKGNEILGYGLSALSAYILLKTRAGLSEVVDNMLSNDVANAAQSDGELDGGKGSDKNAASNKAGKANEHNNNKKNLLNKLDSIGGGKLLLSAATLIAAWAAAILIVIGLIMSIVIPIIPVMAHMLSYIGWLMLVAQLMVISSLIAMTFFLFLDQNDPNTAPEKSLYGTFVNIIIRPFAIIVGFLVAFTLTYVAFIIMDFTSINMIVGLGSTTDFFFNPFKIIMNLILVAVMWIGYIYIIKMIYEASLKAPNNIIKKIGAESMDSRENKTSAILFATAAHSQNKLKDKLIEGRDLKKKAAKEVLMKNNEIYLQNAGKHLRTTLRGASDVAVNATNISSGLISTAMKTIGAKENEVSKVVKEGTQVIRNNDVKNTNEALNATRKRVDSLNGEQSTINTGQDSKVSNHSGGDGDRGRDREHLGEDSDFKR